jgi:hypothetical protein
MIPASIIMLLLTLLSLALAADPTVKDCGAGKSIFTLNAASLLPPNPTPDQSVLFHIDYTVPTGVSISAGEARYAVTYNFIPLTPTVQPLCSVLACPTLPGRYTNDTSSLWPAGLSGSVITKLTWLDDSARLLLCVSIAAQF